jgi:integrase/recombinase XerD
MVVAFPFSLTASPLKIKSTTSQRKGVKVMTRSKKPALSEEGSQHLAQYAHYLQQEQDMSQTTRRNYLSDLHQFIAWCETDTERFLKEKEKEEEPKDEEEQEAVSVGFNPRTITTPLLIRYRTYLQTDLELKPNTVNRYLVSLKGYFDWAFLGGQIERDPTRVLKLVHQETKVPRFLSDGEEEALVAAVNNGGNLRDRTIITLMLHTGLRARETCQLKISAISFGKRGSSLMVSGKGNKYREIPLNQTVRPLLKEYVKSLPSEEVYLFVSKKTKQGITERALGQLVEKYAQQAGLSKVSPHALRHRFGYQMASKNVPLHRLAQIMGHESIDTTLIYTKGTKADLQAEMEKIAWN